MKIDIKSIKEEAHIHQVNYAFLLAQVTSIAEKNNINDVKLQELNMCYDNKIHSYTNEGYIWLSDFKNHYYNDNRGYKIETKKDINYLNLISVYLKDFASSHLLSDINDYKVKKCKDNKPSTLKTYLNNNFLFFAGWNGYRWRTFAVNEYGETLPKEYHHKLDYSFNKKDASETRKTALIVVAVYGNKEKQKEILNKVEKRKPNKLDRYFIDPLHRYCFKDLREYKVLNYCISYDYKSDAMTSASVSGYSVNLNGFKYSNHNYDDYVFNNIFDKSGFCVAYYKEKLKRRLKDIKEEKQRKAEEERKQLFLNSDKSNFFEEVLNNIKYQKSILTSFLKIEVVLLPYAIRVIEVIKNNIKQLQSIGENINTYADKNDPIKEIKNDIEKTLNALNIALTQFNNNTLKWDDCDNYTIKDGYVIARYDWLEKYHPNTQKTLLNTTLPQ